MPYRLVKYGVTGHRPKRMWRWCTAPKDSYDAVIIGGGVHGLGCAYYLAAEHGMRDVAVVEKSYIGSGGSGRNTAIIRSNYVSPEGVAFYDKSLRMYEDLSQELDFNLFFSQRGHLTLAHSEGSLAMMRERAETNRLSGIDSSVVTPEEIEKLVPELDTRADVHHPIRGALYHAPGGIIRHDAVVWAYARGADRLGVDILQETECTGIRTRGGRVVAVETTRGDIATERVHNATAGWCTTISNMVGLGLPVITHALGAFVTEPLKPFLHTVVGSTEMHVYFSQADRGELVVGSSVDPYASYSTRSSLEFLESAAASVLKLMPSLHRVRVLRQWAGLCDMTPDNCPILGATPVEGFTLDVGWGTYGFKAAPVAAWASAAQIATGRTPAVAEPFTLARFEEDRLIREDTGGTH